MIWEVSILKSRWLFYIYLFLQIAIQESTFDIHLEELETHVGYKCYEDSDSFHLSNMGKCLVIVYALLLIIALNNQSRFLPSDKPIFIKLISEHPPGPYDCFVSRSWD